MVTDWSGCHPVNDNRWISWNGFFSFQNSSELDMWAIDKLHGTFTFQNSFSIPPQYIGDKVDQRILIWCTYSAKVKSVCRHIQLRNCSETLCISTSKQKHYGKSKMEQSLVFTFVNCQNISGIKHRDKNKWVEDEILTDDYALGRGFSFESNSGNKL